MPIPGRPAAAPGPAGHAAGSSWFGSSGEVGFHEAGVTHSRQGGRDDGTGPHGGTDDDGFHVELSLPDRIDDGRITRWAGRLILPVFPHGGIVLTGGLASPGSAGDRGIVVEVSRL